jgi:hypothetical protein
MIDLTPVAAKPPEQQTTTTPEPPRTTAALLDALRGHYLKPGDPRPGAVFLTEVTAPDRVHRADAIHVGLWPSRGHTVDVHELKTSRADFTRELGKPEKAEAWWAHSNTFWIVAPDTKVAPPDMLPPGWGLMVPGKTRRFRVVVQAEFRPLSPSGALLAALLISMETDRNKEVERQRAELETRRWRDVEAARRAGALHGDPSARRRLAELEKFEQFLGLKLGEMDWGDEATAVTLATAVRRVVIEKRTAKELGYALDSLDDAAARIRKSVAAARRQIDGAGTVQP